MNAPDVLYPVLKISIIEKKEVNSVSKLDYVITGTEVM